MAEFYLKLLLVSLLFSYSTAEYSCYTKYYYSKICYHFSFENDCQPWNLKDCVPIKTTRSNPKCPRYFCDFIGKTDDSSTEVPLNVKDHTQGVELNLQSSRSAFETTALAPSTTTTSTTTTASTTTRASTTASTTTTASLTTPRRNWRTTTTTPTTTKKPTILSTIRSWRRGRVESTSTTLPTTTTLITTSPTTSTSTTSSTTRSTTRSRRPSARSTTRSTTPITALITTTTASELTSSKAKLGRKRNAKVRKLADPLTTTTTSTPCTTSKPSSSSITSTPLSSTTTSTPWSSSTTLTRLSSTTTSTPWSSSTTSTPLSSTTTLTPWSSSSTSTTTTTTASRSTSQTTLSLSRSSSSISTVTSTSSSASSTSATTSPKGRKTTEQKNFDLATPVVSPEDRSSSSSPISTTITEATTAPTANPLDVADVPENDESKSLENQAVSPQGIDVTDVAQVEKSKSFEFVLNRPNQTVSQISLNVSDVPEVEKSKLLEIVVNRPTEAVTPISQKEVQLDRLKNIENSTPAIILKINDYTKPLKPKITESSKQKVTESPQRVIIEVSQDEPIENDVTDVAQSLEPEEVLQLNPLKKKEFQSPSKRILKGQVDDFIMANQVTAVDCFNKTCELTYEVVPNCYIYVQDEQDPSCQIPCNLNACTVELHHFILCPLWTCESKTSTTTLAPLPPSSTPNPFPPSPSHMCSNPLCVSSVTVNALIIFAILIGVILYKVKQTRRARTAFNDNNESPTNDYDLQHSPIVRARREFFGIGNNESQPLLTCTPSAPSIQPADVRLNMDELDRGQPSTSDQENEQVSQPRGLFQRLKSRIRFGSSRSSLTTLDEDEMESSV